MIWYFLAGMIAGAAGLWLFATCHVKKAEYKRKQYYKWLCKEFSALRDEHPEIYRRFIDFKMKEAEDNAHD